MRDLDAIDADLRILRAVLLSIRAQGHQPSTDRVDALLDERLLAAALCGVEAPAAHSLRDSP